MQQIGFTYTARDYRSAYRLDMNRRLPLRLVLVAGLLLLVPSVWAFWNYGFTWLALIFALMGLILCAPLPMAHMVLPGMCYRSDVLARQEVTLFFDREQLEFRCGDKHSKCGWKKYQAWTEDSHIFLLYHGESGFTIIPRRIFRHESQALMMREMLIAHLGEPI